MAEEKKVIAEEEVAKIQKEVSEALDQSLIEQALSNNEIEFTYNDKKYRVIKPTFEQKQKVHQRRVRKYTQLLKDDDYMLDVVLRKTYKAKGIDIDEMDRQLVTLEQKKHDVSLKLGKAIKDKRPDDELRQHRDQILELSSQQTGISIDKVNLLQYSIETQVNIHVYTYLSYLVAEKETKEGKWEPAFSSFEEFEKTESQLVSKVIMLASFLIKHELELT